MSVLLKKVDFEGVTAKELVQQIEAKKKCREKLPTWFHAPKIYYPNKLNIEQTSSEITAQYKAEIINGKRVLDLTGGFGVDSLFFSKKVGMIFHCEIDRNLSEIATHNFKILGAKNIRTYPGNGIDFLTESDKEFDWIYIDPSRRNDAKGKVFLLTDCLPNVPENLELLFRKSSHLLIKTSPLLDFSVGIKALQFVKEIHVVALRNEVKELLWILEKGYKESISIKTVNLVKSGRETFSFSFSEEKEGYTVLSKPLNYLYEPNTAILKSGAFKTVANRYKVKKLHNNTHLYTSTFLIDFPGRRFEIAAVIPYRKKIVRKLAIQKANITVRNFKESVATIRKQFKIKDGGDIYLFFTKDLHGNYVVLKCLKI